MQWTFHMIKLPSDLIMTRKKNTRLLQKEGHTVQNWLCIHWWMFCPDRGPVIEMMTSCWTWGDPDDAWKLVHHRHMLDDMVLFSAPQGEVGLNQELSQRCQLNDFTTQSRAHVLFLGALRYHQLQCSCTLFFFFCRSCTAWPQNPAWKLQK